MSEEMVNSIAKLDRDVSRMIQSQVTIDSFSSAVRELVYNSVDSGASKIDVMIDLQSLSILIRDDGVGMVPSDLELVGKRYFTSKLKFIDELRNITTFGYRGEALNSLSMISSLTVISKHASSECFRLKSSNSFREFSRYDGNAQLPQDYFHITPIENHGTTIRVANLFSRVPVRKNLLLKVSEHTIVEEIKDIVLQIVVTLPKLSLTVRKIEHIDRQVSNVVSIDRSSQSLEEHCATTLRSIYGTSILKSYQTLNADSQTFLLSGIVGDEPINTKRHQYIFINNKPCVIPKEDLKTFNTLFDSAFFGNDLYDSPRTSPTKFTASLGKPFHKFPIYLVHISSTVNSDSQDPANSTNINELDSSIWKTIKEMLKKVFRDFLKSKGYSIFLSNSTTPSPKKRRTQSKYPTKQLLNCNILSGNIHNLPEPSTPNGDNFYGSQTTSLVGLKKLNNHYGEDEYFGTFHEMKLSKTDLVKGNYRIIRQIESKFILIRFSATTKTNSPYLLVMDQHACDERIKVEELYKKFILSVLLGSSLLLRIVNIIEFEVSKSERSLLAQYKENFKRFGIDYILNDEAVLVTHLPHLLIERMGDILYLKSSILQHLYDLERHIKSDNITSNEEEWFSIIVQLPRAIIDIIKSKACRTSIRFGDTLLYTAMEEMVDNLCLCYLPFQCAHGRPSMIPLVNLRLV
jgi:DNA mismatch repair protein MLH3